MCVRAVVYVLRDVVQLLFLIFLHLLQGKQKQRELLHQHLSTVFPSQKDQSPKNLSQGINTTLKDVQFARKEGVTGVADITISATPKGNFTLSLFVKPQNSDNTEILKTTTNANTNSNASSDSNNGDNTANSNDVTTDIVS